MVNTGDSTVGRKKPTTVKRVATSDLAVHTRVYHNLSCTLAVILVRIAGGRSCIKVVVPSVIGTVRRVAHHAHAPTSQWDKTTTPSFRHEIVRRLYTLGMGATRLRPTQT